MGNGAGQRRDEGDRATPAGVAGPRAALPAGRLDALLLWAAMLGAYTNLSVELGGRFLPGVVCLGCGVVLLVRHAGRALACLGPALGMVLCVAVAALVASAGDGALGQRMQAAGQMAATLLAVSGIVAALRASTRAQLSRGLMAGMLAILALATLEVLTPLRALSDAVRAVLYHGQFTYADDLRDLALHGLVRPKVFTQEPSHPAKFLAVLAAAWFILDPNRRRLLASLAVLAVGLAVMRSPSLLLGPLLIGAFLVLRAAQRRLGPAAGVGLALGMAAVVVLVLANLAPMAGLVADLTGNARAAAVAGGQDASAVTRFLAPPILAVRVLAEHPAFGIGVGARDLHVHDVYEVLAGFPSVDLGAFSASSVYGWDSALFELVILNGLVGSAALLVLHTRLFRPAPAGLAVLFLVLVFAFNAGMVSVRAWVLLALPLAMVDRAGFAGVRPAGPVLLAQRALLAARRRAPAVPVPREAAGRAPLRIRPAPPACPMPAGLQSGLWPVLCEVRETGLSPDGSERSRVHGPP